MMETPRVLPPTPRPTQVPGLDAVLGGGLPDGDLLFVVGAPGCGKTILALQIGFMRVRDGAKVLLLTTFSESHDKLVAHLSSFSFFDPLAIGQQLQFLSILPMIEEGGDETVRTVVRTVRQQGVDLVIIDGFRGIRDAFPSDFATRQFLQLLGTQLAYLRTTLIITVETDADDSLLYSELTTADSIIALQRQLLGRQHRRMLEVRKLRGQAPLPGLHRYHIDSGGITVFPRIEAVDTPSLPAPEPGRAAFGLAPLDAMLMGGLTTATTTLLCGSPGTGKTLLGLHYLLAGIAAGEEALLVTVHESEEQLRDKARAFGLDFEAALQSGRLRLLRRPPAELDVDELADVIRRDVLDRPVRRMVFDGVSPLQYALDREDRSQDYLAAMVELLRVRQVTSVFLLDVAQLLSSALDFSNMPFFVLSSNTLLLRHVEYRSRLHRIISVVKTRFSEHDPTLREFTIGADGITIGEPLVDVEGQLTGVAQETNAAARRQRKGGAGK